MSRIVTWNRQSTNRVLIRRERACGTKRDNLCDAYLLKSERDGLRVNKVWWGVSLVGIGGMTLNKINERERTRSLVETDGALRSCNG